MINFPADDLGLAVQLQCTRTQVISQAVAIGVIAKMLGHPRFPVQHLHRRTAGLGRDDMQNLALDIAHFKSRQVAGFTDDRACTGLRRAHLALAHAVSAVDVTLGIVEFRCPLYWTHMMELIARIPTQYSTRLQGLQVTVVVKSRGYFRFGRRETIALRQTAVAVFRGGKPSPMLLRPVVDQFQQVATDIVTIGLAVVGHGLGVFDG
ncbi:hypothetical protein D3C85_815970 [compost metagenome]